MSTLTLRPTTVFPAADDRTATEPPEHRGLRRDEVRLLVATPDGVSHHRFADLPCLLRPGDLLIVNNSRTVPGEIDGRLRGGGDVVLHVAGDLDDGTWVVEIRTAPDAAAPVLHAGAGDIVDLTGWGHLRLLRPYPDRGSSPTGQGNRLWVAAAEGDPDSAVLGVHLRSWGRPIAYGYLSGRFPLSDYQTVFAQVPGSAEMPSAARPFSHRLVTRLVSAGIFFATITLHTRLSSQEAGESPQPERFEVPAGTARLVNQTRAAGGRVIAVGTTATRAIETAVRGGLVHPARGWTDRVVSPADPVRVVDGLITGWHNPDASHLLLVESVAGAEVTARAYRAAVGERYLWHEFGDSGLVLRR